jgi:predicted flavoprotein YhiN
VGQPGARCGPGAALARAKASSRKLIANELAALVPSRLADAWASQDVAWQRPVNEATDKALAALAAGLARWELLPSGTEGYRKAEVTAGGVDTRELSSQTMESKQPGLYFIGRSGGRDRLAGGLQLPVGLGQRPCLRHGPARAGHGSLNGAEKAL